MLKGIDVSKYQTTTPPLDGLDFLFARASYATTLDPKYVTHTVAARKAGLIVGAYHFGVGFKTPAEQAYAFLRAADSADLLALDLEADRTQTMSQVQAREFIRLVHVAGRKIGLYHSRSSFPSLGQDWNWVAHWGVTTPPNIPWAFWQYRGSPLDLDYFNGTRDQLDALAGKATPPPAPPKPQEPHLILKANASTPVPTLVDVKKGGQVFHLDGAPLVKWSRDYTVTSLGQSGQYDLIVVTTSGTRQYALVLTSAVRNRRPVTSPVPNPIPTPKPVPVPTPPPAPSTPPINLIPIHKPSTQPPGDSSFVKYGWSAAYEDGWSKYGAWVTRPAKFPNYPEPPASPEVFILVHGGPLSINTFAGMDSVASWVASRGGIGVAIKYPMLLEDGTWLEGVAAIQQAIAKGKATGAKVTLVGHSAGGFFISLAAFQAPSGAKPDRVVFVAADDQVSGWPQPTQPPNPRESYGANKIPTTVIVGSGDMVTTVAEGQAMVTALNAAGHPGKWIVIDPAGHSDILSDVNFINELLP